jgi:hypothetical protein
MISVDGNTFVEKNIRIDKARYKNCTFTRCIIEYGGEGPVVLDTCTFDECTWTFVGPAKQTMDFLAVMQSSFGEFGKGLVKSVFDGIVDPGQRGRVKKLPDSDI